MRLEAAQVIEVKVIRVEPTKQLIRGGRGSEPMQISTNHQSGTEG